MEKKEVVHKKVKEKELDKYKPKKKPRAVIGKEYTLEDIQDLLADIRGKERDKAIGASIQFIQDNNAIGEAVSKNADLDMDSISREAFEIVIKDAEIILEVLEETNNIETVRFMAKSEEVTPEINRKAASILNRMEAKKPETAEFEKKKEKVPETREFTPAKVKALWKGLRSTDRKIRVSAAIRVFTDYSKIAKAMPKIPGLTITHIVNRAKDVFIRNTDPVLRDITKTWNKAAIGFLASSRSIPPELARKAKAALIKMEKAPAKPEISQPRPNAPRAETPKPETPRPKTAEVQKAQAPATQAPAPVRNPETRKPEIPKPETVDRELETPKPETAKTLVVGEKEIKVEQPAAPLKFNIRQVKQLWRNLQSKQKSVAIKAAMDVFSNYQDLSQVLPKIPMMTISQFVGKASDIASRNMQVFFNKLGSARNRKALEFIVDSQAIPPKLSKKAKEALEMLLHEEKEEKKPIPKVTFKEGGEPDDGS